MIESVEEFDLLILKDYNSEVKEYYRLNAAVGESYITKLACKVRIKPEETNHFIDAWEKIMTKFKIPTDHHNYILYITQSFYSKLELDNKYFEDLTNANNALTFFTNLIGEATQSQKVSKLTSLNETIGSKFNLQLQSKYSGNSITLNYPQSTNLIIDHLYKSIKLHNPILLGHLGRSISIPPIDILNKAQESVQFQLDNPLHFLLVETITDLQNYLNTYLSKELSRKTHLFIFELLYLFDFLKYAGKVTGRKGSDFALKNEPIYRMFTPYTYVKDSDKSLFIKSLVKKGYISKRYQRSKANL